MSRATAASSNFYHPLDIILGTSARVRILRVLFLHGGELSASDLAARTELTRAGAWRALHQLEEIGIVESVSTGRSAPLRVNRRHPLAKPLGALFKSEASRLDRLFEEIRGIVENLETKPLAVWLFARGGDPAGIDMELALVFETEKARMSAGDFRRRLIKRAGKWVTQPSVVTWTLSDLRTLQRRNDPYLERPRQDGVTLYGRSPEELIRD